MAHQRTLRTIAAHAALAIDTADRFARPDRSTAGNAQQPAQTDALALLTLIAHDLRGPLTALSSSIQMLVRATKQPDNAANQQITRLTELAEVAVAQLETQISALTPRAGAQRQSGGSDGEPVDLVKLAHLMAHFYQQTTARQRFIVVADVAELYCRCPRSQAERVIGNLLVNAIKYSSSGSDIRIIVNREEDLLGDWAALSVQNDGIGIPAQDLTHLTNPGFRATNVGPIPGTGFGLASVREVVEQYGGTFAVQSTVGAATTVQIRLPLSGQAHQKPVHAAYAHA
jgi:signal transduction histidine kinase